jgi:hypothetical protein
MVENQRMDRLKTPSRIVLAAYVVALLISTHLPHLPDVLLTLGEYDKWIHGGMYAGLAIVIAWNWSLHRQLGWRQWAAVLALCAAFGLFDEVTQILVGRTCDFFDWLADMLGTSIGLTTFVVAATLYRRPQRRLREV